MLSIEVKAHLAEVMEKVYTKAELRRLANKLGVVIKGLSKPSLIDDFLSKIPEDREKDLIRRVVLDARKIKILKEVEESLGEFERVLESNLLFKVDRNGNIVPIVEPSIEPDIGKERGFLEQQMEKDGFELASSQFREALETYKTSYRGSIALFRNSLEALIKEMIKQKGKHPPPIFTDNIAKLTEVGILKKTEKGEEVKAVQSLFGMLAHYGSHPEYVTDETAQLLYVWTISILSFLIKRFEKASEK